MCSRRYTPDTTDIMHFSHCGTKAYTSAQQKSVSSVCSQVTACFTSAYVRKRLPARCFLRDPKKCKSLGARVKLQGGSPRACQPQHRTYSSVCLFRSLKQHLSDTTDMWLRFLLLRNTKFCGTVDNTLISKCWLHVYHVPCVSRSRNNNLGTSGRYLNTVRTGDADLRF